MATDLMYRMLNDLASMPWPADKSEQSLAVMSLIKSVSDSIEGKFPFVDVTPSFDLYRSGQFSTILAPFVGKNVKMPWPKANCFARLARGTFLFTVRDVPQAEGNAKDCAVNVALSSVMLFAEPGKTGFVDVSSDGGLVTTLTALAKITMTLASARNAHWEESAPNRATRKRYPSVAGIRFSHIEIDMGRPKRTGERRNEDPEHGVPWHHRRGHWAYYHPDRPAFGRPGAHGWYWRPFTEVGDKAFGEVVQDYTVAVPIAPGEP